MEDISPQARFILRPMSVHLPARTRQALLVPTTPLDDGIVRGPEARVIPPMGRRSDFADRQCCRPNVTDGVKRCGHTNAKRHVCLRRLIRHIAVDEDVLAVQSDEAGPADRVHLVQVTSEGAGHSADGNTCVYGGDDAVRRELQRDSVLVGARHGVSRWERRVDRTR
jgi:hypothetical protein